MKLFSLCKTSSLPRPQVWCDILGNIVSHLVVIWWLSWFRFLLISVVNESKTNVTCQCSVNSSLNLECSFSFWEVKEGRHYVSWHHSRLSSKILYVPLSFTWDWIFKTHRSLLHCKLLKVKTCVLFCILCLRCNSANVFWMKGGIPGSLLFCWWMEAHR